MHSEVPRNSEVPQKDAYCGLRPDLFPAPNCTATEKLNDVVCFGLSHEPWQLPEASRILVDVGGFKQRRVCCDGTCTLYHSLLCTLVMRCLISAFATPLPEHRAALKSKVRTAVKKLSSARALWSLQCYLLPCDILLCFAPKDPNGTSASACSKNCCDDEYCSVWQFMQPLDSKGYSCMLTVINVYFLLKVNESKMLNVFSMPAVCRTNGVRRMRTKYNYNSKKPQCTARHIIDPRIYVQSIASYYESIWSQMRVRAWVYVGACGPVQGSKIFKVTSCPRNGQCWRGRSHQCTSFHPYAAEVAEGQRVH